MCWGGREEERRSEGGNDEPHEGGREGGNSEPHGRGGGEEGSKEAHVWWGLNRHLSSEISTRAYKLRPLASKGSNGKIYKRYSLYLHNMRLTHLTGGKERQGDRMT